MNARERLTVMVRTDRGSMTVWSPSEVRDALDAFRAEVLREAAAALEASALGESLVYAAARLRRMADGAEVGEKSSRPAADATPGPSGRVARLLDAIRTSRGRWTTVRAAQFYRDARLEPPGAQWSRTRTVARGDLRDLAAWGHLIRHEEPGRTYFTLKTRKDAR